MLLGSSPPKILILTCRCCWILLPGGRARLHTGPGLAGVSRCRGASGVHWFWFGRCGGRKSNDRRVPSVKRTQELIPTLEMIFNAVKAAGIRAIVSAGWGGLGGAEVPPNIFILPGHPGVPHDWLFTKVSAVCHRKSCLCPANCLRLTIECSRRRSWHDSHWAFTRKANNHCPVLWGPAVLGQHGLQGWSRTRTNSPKETERGAPRQRN